MFKLYYSNYDYFDNPLYAQLLELEENEKKANKMAPFCLPLFFVFLQQLSMRQRSLKTRNGEMSRCETTLSWI